MADIVFEDPFDDTIEEIRSSLFSQVETLWPDPNERPDMREGSLLWTLLSPVAFEILRFQGDLNLALQIGFLQFTFGEFLDLKGTEIGLDRKQGSQAEGILRFFGDIGTAVPLGTSATSAQLTPEDDVYVFNTTDIAVIDGVENPTSVDETQLVKVFGADRFTITFDGSTTTPLSADATGSTIAAAIEALAPTPNYTTIGLTGDSGIANNEGSKITFDGGDVADKDIPILVASPYQVNEEQTVRVSGTAPYTFTVTFDGQTAAAVLDETSDGTDLETAINSLSPHPTYGSFSVSCLNGATNLSAPGGVSIVFSGGGVQYTDIPLLQINTVSGTLTPTVTEVTPGEDSQSVIEVSEIVKGRNAKPVASTSDKDEIQRVTFTKPEIEVDKVTTGVENNLNQIQRLTVPGTPVSGTFTLTFSDGVTSDSTTIDLAAITPTDWDASSIEANLKSLSNIGNDDVTVTLVSGGPEIEDGNAVFDIEFVGNLRNKDFNLITVSAVSLVDGASVPTGNPTVVLHQPSDLGVNEKQSIYFTDTLTPGYGPVPDGGFINILLQDDVGGVSSSVGPITYNANAATIKASLESSSIYGTTTNGTFSVTGGPLNIQPVFIEFTGNNRHKPFKKLVITENFSGVTSTGTYKLNYNGHPSSTAAISVTDSTQTVETKLNTYLGTYHPTAGSVDVYSVNGVQTLEYVTTPSGPFTLSIESEALSGVTGSINSNATATDVKNAIEAVTGTGTVKVYSSDGNVLDNSGTVFTIHFLNANEYNYKHLVPSLNEFKVGPDLTTEGSTYEVVFSSGGKPQIVPNTAVGFSDATIGPVVRKSLSDGSKQLLTLSHPVGVFKLKWGGSSPYTTAYIHPLFDDEVSIKNKIEAIGDINSEVDVNFEVIGASNLYDSPVSITFSGATLSSIDWPNFIVISDLVSGGKIEDVDEVVKGFGGGGGVVTGTVQYAYTITTKLGYQDSPTDTDYESGYGFTGLSEESVPIVVSNNNISVEIAPVAMRSGLYEPKRVNVYRKLTVGFTSTPYKLIKVIEGDELKTVALGESSASMFVTDDVPLALFNSVNDVAPSENTTGVIDIYSKAEEIGTAQNLSARSISVLGDLISGVNKVVNPEAFGGGSDVELDDDYRARLLDYIQKDPGAGNISDYVSWATEISGVVGASVVPEWQEIYGPLEGPGTVKVIVSGENSTILPDSKVEEVRQYIMGTVAIPNPDQENGPAASVLSGGSIEPGVYEYAYSFINVGKGETELSAHVEVEVTSGNQTVQLFIEKGQSGLGVQNTIGRRIYRRKIDGAVSGEPDSEKYVLVAEVLNNDETSYTDSSQFSDLPTWRGYPSGPYERRKAPISNSTSLYDGLAPIGAHVSVQSITEETVWVGATIYPSVGYSLDGTGGTTNLTTLINDALAAYFTSLAAGEDIKIINIANILHDLGTEEAPAIKDFKDLKLYSPLYPEGTTDNISIGGGVSAAYSTAGTFSLWSNYQFDK